MRQAPEPSTAGESPRSGDRRSRSADGHPPAAWRARSTPYSPYLTRRGPGANHGRTKRRDTP